MNEFGEAHINYAKAGALAPALKGIWKVRKNMNSEVLGNLRLQGQEGHLE